MFNFKSKKLDKKNNILLFHVTFDTD